MLMSMVTSFFIFSVLKNFIHLFSKNFFFFSLLFSIFFTLSPHMEVTSLTQYSVSLSKFSFWFSCLSLWGGVVLCSASSFVENSSFLILKFKNMVFLIMVLVMCFNVNSLINFYFFFELSLIPILFLILGWGYQPERIFASYSLILYTFMASLPLLFMVIVLKKIMFSGRFLFIDSSELILFSGMNSMFVMALIMGFLVKLPVFFVHLWLPRAHVEAPVEGSMILASVMLKLGGYGIFRVIPLLSNNFFTINFVLSFVLAGGAAVSFICVRQTDLKTLIAYSSIAHMAMAAAASFCMKHLALWAAAAAYISHGFVSSGLFLGANFLYFRAHTRNLVLIKSSLSFVPIFSLFWFIFCMGNMGAPPTPNLISEIFLICSVMSVNFVSFIPVFFLTFLSTVFTLNLYMFTQHGQNSLKQSYLKKLFMLEISNMLNHFFLIFFGGIFIFLMI